MHPEDLHALVIRIQAGDAEGLSILIAGTRAPLRMLIARYAATTAMADEAFRETWAAAYRDIAGCPPDGFTAWIDAQVRGQLARLLREGEQKAAFIKDALGHVMQRPAIDALASGTFDAEAESQRLKTAVDALEAKSRQIVIARYGEQAAIDAIAKLVGETPAKVGSLLFRARAALGGSGDLGNEVAKADPLFLGLVEDCLNGLIVPDARELLAGSVLKDLRYSTLFEAQVRSDLMLRAAYEPANLDAARTFAYALVNPGGDGERKPMKPSEPRVRAAGALSERLPAATRPPARSGPWLWIGVGLVLLAVVGGVIALNQQAPAPRPATTTAATITPVEPPKPAGEREASTKVDTAPVPTASGPEVAKIESGLGSVHRAGGRTRLQPGASIHAGDGLDTDGAQSALLLAFPGQRKATLGADSALGELPAGEREASTKVDAKGDTLTLDHGQLSVDSPAGGRGFTVRVGQFSVTGDEREASTKVDAAFTVRTSAGGIRVEVARGSARILRADKLLATVPDNQTATVGASGDLELDTAGIFVAGIKLGGIVPGGQALVFDGHRWKSSAHAQADGLTLSGGEPATVDGLGGVDAKLKTLLATALVGSVQLSQALPNGSYDVMVWVVGSPGSDAGTLIVAGQPMPSDTAGLGTNGWRRFGPLRATVADRHLDLRYSGAKEQKLAGVAFYACGAVAGGLPPSAFLNEPKDGLELVAPVKVTIKADAYSPDGAISRVEFYADATKIGEANRPPYAFIWTCQSDGTYKITARAITLSGSAASLPATISVKAAEKPKPALIVATRETVAYTAPATITLTATLAHLDATVSKVAFAAGGAAIGEAAAPPFEVAWSKVAAGDYAVTATATFAGGGTLVSGPLALTVAAPANLPPVVAIESPDDGDEVADSGRLTIRAKASDDDGKVVKVEFFADEQKLGETALPPYSFTWPKAAAGTHRLTAVASDDRGAKTTSDPTLVIVGKNSGFNLIRGVNLGGAAVEIEGGHWLSHDEALADGLSLGAGKVGSEQTALAPAAEGDLAAMLSASYQAGQDELTINQECPNGIFQICLWMCETTAANAHVCELELQGVKQAQPIGRLAKGVWAKYGPYLVKVKNQRLSLALRTKNSTPVKLAGLAIYAPPWFSLVKLPGIFPKPTVEVLFDSVLAGATPNTGLSAGVAPTAVFSALWPQPSNNVPPGGGSGSCEFGKEHKGYGVDLPGSAKALRGFKSFTISAWVNIRDLKEGGGGDKIVNWRSDGSSGVDLAYHDDGSIQIGVNAFQFEKNGVGAPRSGKGLTANANTPADNWRFLAVTYDSTLPAQQLRYYFGSPTAKVALDRALDYARGPVGTTNTPDLAIGHYTASMRKRPELGDRMFRGLIDQVRIWGSGSDGSGALTPEQLLAVQGTSPRTTLRPGAAKTAAPSDKGLQVWLNAATGLNPPSGTISKWEDQSGHGHDAEQTKSGEHPVTAVKDNGKPALAFGDNDSLDIANSTALDPDAFTASAWIRYETIPPGGDTRRFIIGKNGSEHTSGHFSLFTEQGFLSCYLNIGGGPEHLYLLRSPPGLIKPRLWQQVAMTWDGAKLCLFLDGARVAEKMVNQKRVAGNTAIVIGRRPDHWGMFMGQLDEVRFYDRVLDDSEIQGLERWLRPRWFAPAEPKPAP